MYVCMYVYFTVLKNIFLIISVNSTIIINEIDILIDLINLHISFIMKNSTY